MRSKYHLRSSCKALLFFALALTSTEAGADCRYSPALPQNIIARTAPVLRFERLKSLGKGDEIWLKCSIKCGGSGTINVRHGTGIGSLKVVRLSKRWPEKLKVQFYNFNSLENVTISGVNGKFEYAQKYGKISRRVIEIPRQLLDPGSKNNPNKQNNEITVSWVDAYR